MMLPQHNEHGRLAALHQYDILDTPPEGQFDDLSRLAAQICDTPIALIGMVDANRLWLKSALGMQTRQIPREIAFCAHGILQSDLFIVPDALADDRFADNPLVTNDPWIRFYAGAPLIAPSGHTLGMLCVKDTRPRDLSPAQVEALRMLGRQVVAQLELRRHTVQLQEVQRLATERRQIEAALQDSQILLQLVIDNIPQSLAWKDSNSVFLGCNRRFAENMGLAGTTALIGKTDYDLPAAEFAELYRADDRQVIESGIAKVNFEEPHTAPDGSQSWLRTSKVPLRDRTGAVVGVVVMFEDITAYKREEQERAQLKDDLIRAQSAALAELSTPLVPISDRVVAMPLIGAIDSRRAQQVLETLLEGVASSQAQVAIVDITGVSIVDTHVANGLLRAAQAVQLLGAQVVLTGIRPEVAQTLVSLNVDLRSIITRSTLQSGIAFALGRALQANRRVDDKT